jgi:hypothetical protein
MSVVIGTRVVDCDRFDKPSTCSKVWEPLSSGLVFDALETVIVRRVGQKQFPALSASYCAHGDKNLHDMFVRSELRRIDVVDDSFFIDDVGDASWKEPQRFRNRKCLAE